MICDKPMNPGTMDGEAVVCGKEPGHAGDCGDWTGSTSRDGDTITLVPEEPGDRIEVDPAVGKALDEIATGFLASEPLSIKERLNILTLSYEGELSAGPGFPNLFTRYERTVRDLEHEHAEIHILADAVVEANSDPIDAAIDRLEGGEHDPGDRFSEDLLVASGKAFIAVAMEHTTTRCHVAPFSVSIEVEASRSMLTLSFQDPNAALVWITNLRNLIGGHLRPVEDTKQ